jgi:hypothetical protein
MEFYFDCNLFHRQDCFPDLDLIFQRIFAQIHSIDFSNIETITNSPWYQDGRSLTKSQFLEYITSSPLTKRTPTKKISIHDPTTLKYIQKSSYTPLKIYIEDREADGIFLDLIFKYLAESSIFSQWEVCQKSSPRGYEYVSASINQIKERVERELEDAQQQNRMRRVFILCDSDKRWPNETVKTSFSIENFCKEENLPFHILTKRNLENYIPDEIFQYYSISRDHQKHQQKYQIYLKLTDEEKYYFPIKSGLSEEEYLKAYENGSYKNLSKEDRDALKERLFDKKGRPIKKILQDENLKKLITEKTLLSKNQNNELIDLTTKIIQEI